MIRYIRDIQARRKGVELEPGFTLIELLIVIVVLGILAATVIFALGGVTSQSAQAACQSDGKSYEVAVAAYENAPKNTSNAAPTTTAELTAGPYGSMLHQAANNPHYFVLPGRRTAWRARLLPRRPPADGTVWVGPTVASAVGYDGQSSVAPLSRLLQTLRSPQYSRATNTQ